MNGKVDDEYDDGDQAGDEDDDVDETLDHVINVMMEHIGGYADEYQPHVPFHAYFFVAIFQLTENLSF